MLKHMLKPTTCRIFVFIAKWKNKESSLTSEWPRSAINAQWLKLPPLSLVRFLDGLPSFLFSRLAIPLSSWSSHQWFCWWLRSAALALWRSKRQRALQILQPKSLDLWLAASCAWSSFSCLFMDAFLNYLSSMMFEDIQIFHGVARLLKTPVLLHGFVLSNFASRTFLDLRLAPQVVGFLYVLYCNSHFTSFVTAIQKERSQVDGNDVLVVLLTAAVGYVVAESFMSGTAAIRPPPRDQNFRPSGWQALGNIRGLYIQRAAEINSVSAAKPKLEGSTEFAKSIATLGVSLQSLSTGQKLRSELIESTFTFTLAIAIMCSAVLPVLRWWEAVKIWPSESQTPLSSFVHVRGCCCLICFVESSWSAHGDVGFEKGTNHSPQILSSNWAMNKCHSLVGLFNPY